jgi:division protein CdvB (Snf7/Vps24/ESCRT-III family)
MLDQHQQQFKSDIEKASSVVNNQLARLKMLDEKFSAMDKNFRHQIVLNIKSGNNSRAKALAGELSNIRNVQRTTQNAGLALEVMLIRFSTINEFAMVLETIHPTIGMIRDIQRDISKVIPAASNVFSEMKSITSDVLTNSDIKLDVGSKFSAPVDKDALSILNEIEGMLETEAKEKLPEVPSAILDKKMDKQLVGEQVSDTSQIMIEG